MNQYLRRRIHVSWHFAWLAAGILFGAAFAPFNTYLQPDLSWMIFGLSLLFFVFRKCLAYFAIIALFAGLLIGSYRSSLELNGRNGYKQYFNKSVTISGVISDDVTFGSHDEKQLEVKTVRINDQKLPGTIWVSSNTSLVLKRSDNLKLSGYLTEGFGNYPAVLSNARIISVERNNTDDIALMFRDWFASNVHNVISEPEASLGLGFLVGQRSTLPEEFENQLRIVGLTHIVVASGYNLTILVGVTRRLFERISKYIATVTASVLIIGFMFITGFSPSMSRAGLVSGLSLAAWYYGRKMHPLVLLPFTAAITVLINPAFMWGDLGWYLSFAAFTGVILVAPLIHHYFWGNKKKPGIFREIIVATIAAQAVTLPIILFTFGKISLLSLPANILVLPLVPLAMLLTFVSGLAGSVISNAYWLGLPASSILRYMIEVVEKTSQISRAQSEVQFNLLMLTLSYLVLAGVTLYLWFVTKHNFRSKNSANII